MKNLALVLIGICCLLVADYMAKGIGRAFLIGIFIGLAYAAGAWSNR